ncbi:MAG: PQQ-like beta-propeller repeat protein [Planctomycetes bacterium]|nr:PQQ-like beta-propeller repeat protein [Planctomycetota bacterium]
MTTRRVLLILGIVAIPSIGAYVAYRKGWFAHDSVNTAEIAELKNKKLDQQPPAESGSGWFQWRGPTRDGRAPAGPLRTDWDKNPPKRLWRSECGGGFSSCVVVGGKLYTQDRQGNNERIICLNAEDGKPIWEFSYPADYTGIDYNSGPRATPTVEGDRLWAVGGRGELTCLRLPREPGETVQKTWSKNLPQEFQAPIPQWGVAGSPLLVGDMIVVQPGGKKGAVVAFDKQTGDVKWASGSNSPSYSSAVIATVAGQPTIFAFLGDALLAIRTDGKITDTYPWPTKFGGNIATPLVVDDYVFISSAYEMGCALLRAEKRGDEVKLVQVYERRGRAFQTHHSTSVFKDRYLFGFDRMTSSAELKCVAFDTGEEKEGWEASGLKRGSGSIILADKHLIIQTENGELCLVEATPEEFRLVTKIPKVLSGKNNWATPTLLDGRLYLRDETQVVCYDVRP